MNKLLLSWSFVCLVSAGIYRSVDQTQREMAFRDVAKGDVLAWAEHITGQDVNDWTIFDTFESVTTIPGSSTKPCGDTNYEDEVWVIVQRTIDGNDCRCVEQFTPMDWGNDPNYCWFVDCGIGGTDVNSYGGEDVAYRSSLTYFGGNAKIYGVQLEDGTIRGLDAGGSAVNRGGGIVGLPYEDHPFQIGDTIRVTGTTNYNGTHTVTAGTTTDEIQFADTYNAETFDGTERVVIERSVAPGLGRCAIDSSEYLYYAHNWDAENSTFVTRYDIDGTPSYDFLNHSWNGSDPPDSSAAVLDIKVQGDYLYIMWDRHDIIEKYQISTGDLVWHIDAGLDNGYDLEVDSAGNVYAKVDLGYTYPDEIVKFDSTDGSVVWESDEDGARYGCNIEVDEDNGWIVTSGYSSGADPDQRWNIATWNYSDGTLIAQLALDGVYLSGKLYYSYKQFAGYLDIYNGFIYCIQYDSQNSPGTTVYKLDSDLNVIASTTGPTYGCGLFIDHFGNVVVVNQDWVAAQSTIFYYYDSDDLSLIDSYGTFNNAMFKTWTPLVGDVYTQGNIVHTITTDTSSDVGVEPNTVEIGHLPNMEVCVYAQGRPFGVYDVTVDANDNYVIDLGDTYEPVIAGINYFSIYESFPLTKNKTRLFNAAIDFYESLGANVGVTYEATDAWLFSTDDFATQLDPVTDIKFGTIPRGLTNEPVLYLWIWEPLPLCIRGWYPTMEIAP